MIIGKQSKVLASGSIRLNSYRKFRPVRIVGAGIRDYCCGSELLGAAASPLAIMTGHRLTCVRCVHPREITAGNRLIGCQVQLLQILFALVLINSLLCCYFPLHRFRLRDSSCGFQWLRVATGLVHYNDRLPVAATIPGTVAPDFGCSSFDLFPFLLLLPPVLCQ